ncbi:MAG: hypothetical protein J1F31_03950 [Erysipelotrichales bacterium]|nr:hypothetical protein [Erysipelotrichales bacterium]
MNKRILFLLPLVLLGSCGNNGTKIEVDYDDIGGFVSVVNVEDYMSIFNGSGNTLTIFAIKDANYCSECLNVSLSNTAQYAIDHHFIIYFYEFDLGNGHIEKSIRDYNKLVEMMKVNNDNGLKELTYQDGVPVFDGLPCLMYSSKGYIGYNVTSNFIPQLKSTIVVKENS